MAPERQRIVYRGREIKDCTLEQAGVVDNSSFVVVERRAHVGTSRPAIESSPAKELIHEMTTKLAEQKGNLLSRSNSTAAVGQDRSARSALASISDIQQLLNAITTDVDHNITDNPLWRDSGLAGERGEDGEEVIGLVELVNKCAQSSRHTSPRHTPPLRTDAREARGDGSRPCVDGNRQCVDGNRPCVDGNRSCVDGNRQCVDGNRQSISRSDEMSSWKHK